MALFGNVAGSAGLLLSRRLSPRIGLLARYRAPPERGLRLRDGLRRVEPAREPTIRPPLRRREAGEERNRERERDLEAGRGVTDRRGERERDRLGVCGRSGRAAVMEVGRERERVSGRPRGESTMVVAGQCKCEIRAREWFID